MVVKHIKMPGVGTETKCTVIAAQKSQQKKKQRNVDKANKVTH